MSPSIKRPNTSDITPQPNKRHETAKNSSGAPGSPLHPSQVGQKTVPPSSAGSTANIPEPHDDYTQRVAVAAWRSVPPPQLDAPSSSAQQSSRRSPAGSVNQGTHVGQKPVLPNFAQFIANLSEPSDDHTQSPAEAGWPQLPPLQLDDQNPNIQQHSLRPPASSTIEGRVAQAPQTSSAGLNPIAQERTSGSEPSPTLQPASPLPADRLSRTPTTPAPKPTASASGKPRRVYKLVDPGTGEPATESTKDPIPDYKFRRSKLVDADTGEPATEDTKNPITVAKFNARKLLDPETGKAALKNTKDPVTRSMLYKSQLVDPLSGDPIRPGATNGIPYQKYKDSMPVHPDSGESVLPGTKGAITIAAFRGRQKRKLIASERAPKSTKSSIPGAKFDNRNRLVDPKTGDPATEKTKDPITHSKYVARNNLVDPTTGEPATEKTENPMTAGAFFHKRLVDPGSGKLLRAGQTGGIPYREFNMSRLVHPDSGKPAEPGTEGAIPKSDYVKLRRRNKTYK
jgi:hypothetical protein